MSKIVRLRLIVLLNIVVLFALVTQSASARGSIFVVKPKQVVVEEVNLEVSSEVVGDLSVGNGIIDFWVASPSGVVLFCDQKIANKSFSFVAKENGSYTMHLSNTYLTQSVTVTLNYGINMNITVAANINVGASAGVARVVGPPPPLPSIDDPRPNLDNLYERYLNLLKGSVLLRTVRDCGTYFPIHNMALVMGCIALAAGLIEVGKRHSQQRNVLNTHIRRRTASL
jgi:hypothetical protein